MPAVPQIRRSLRRGAPARRLPWRRLYPREPATRRCCAALAVFLRMMRELGVVRGFVQIGRAQYSGCGYWRRLASLRGFTDGRALGWECRCSQNRRCGRHLLRRSAHTDNRHERMLEMAAMRVQINIPAHFAHRVDCPSCSETLDNTNCVNALLSMSAKRPAPPGASAPSEPARPP